MDWRLLSCHQTRFHNCITHSSANHESFFNRFPTTRLLRPYSPIKVILDMYVYIYIHHGCSHLYPLLFSSIFPDPSQVSLHVQVSSNIMLGVWAQCKLRAKALTAFRLPTSARLLWVLVDSEWYLGWQTVPLSASRRSPILLCFLSSTKSKFSDILSFCLNSYSTPQKQAWQQEYTLELKIGSFFEFGLFLSIAQTTIACYSNYGTSSGWVLVREGRDSHNRRSYV